MGLKPQYVWYLQKTPDSLRMAVVGDEIAQLYREAGWRTTRLSRRSFSSQELRCLEASSDYRRSEK